jgi:hypothetical protein
MARKHESKRHIEDANQAEVFAAICYLDPELKIANEQQSYDAGVVICVLLVIVELGALFLLFCEV